jgi:hypothetical protein
MLFDSSTRFLLREIVERASGQARTDKAAMKKYGTKFRTTDGGRTVAIEPDGDVTGHPDVVKKLGPEASDGDPKTKPKKKKKPKADDSTKKKKKKKPTKKGKPDGGGGGDDVLSRSTDIQQKMADREKNKRSLGQRVKDAANFDLARLVTDKEVRQKMAQGATGVGKRMKNLANYDMKRLAVSKEARQKVFGGAKGVGAAVKRKAADAAKGVAHEVKEVKGGGKALLKMANGKKLDDEDKQALKATGKILAKAAIGTAGFAAFGIGSITAAHIVEHAIAEAVLVNVGRAAMFASLLYKADLTEGEQEQLERYLTDMLEKVGDKLSDMKDMSDDDMLKVFGA